METAVDSTESRGHLETAVDSTESREPSAEMPAEDAEFGHDMAAEVGESGEECSAEAAGTAIGSQAELAIYEQIRNRFDISEKDMRTWSPLTLAYIGDSIYDLTIRSIVVGHGNTKASNLHRQTSRLVMAHAQSAMMAYIQPLLTDEEKAVYKRGRNAKSPTIAKHATVSDYRRATGFEALMGYLYLKNEMSRMLDLVEVGLKGYKEECRHPAK